jgi:serine/threonine-protein kinase
MLALQVPYRGEDEPATERLVIEGRPEAIRPRNRRVEHDVETVVLCAMDRDPARRYASCADFARDLGHLLAHRPIEARRPGPLLRTRRWIQRHPAAALAIVVVPALVLAAAVTIILGESRHARELGRQLTDTRDARDAARAETERATREKEAAERALDFVVDMFNPRTEVDGSGELRTVPELFAHGEELVEADLAGDGAARARLLTTLAHVFHRQGNHEKALELCTRARRIWHDLDRRENDPYLAQTLTCMAGIENTRGHVPEACELLREALPLLPDMPEWARDRKATYGDLGRLDTTRSGSEAMLSYAKDALARERARPKPDPMELASRRADLGFALLKLDRRDEAAPELEAAAVVLAAPDARPSRDTIALLSNLADVRVAEDRYDDALALSDRALGMARSICPRHSEALGIQYGKRATFEEDHGRLPLALENFRSAIDAYDGVFPIGHPQVLAVLGGYAELAGHMRQESEAVEAACQVLTITAGRPELAGRRGQAWAGLAGVDALHKDRAAAEEDWSRALCCYHAAGSVTCGLDAYLSLAKLSLARHDVAGAESFLESALASALEAGKPAPIPILQGLAEVCRLAGHESAALSYASRLQE